MDLSEVRTSSSQRHPWETARADAIERILKARQIRPNTILDFGCGDGFTGERLALRFGSTAMWGVDVHLSGADCERRSNPKACYANDVAALGDRTFDLGLLCDVIEHVEDDRGLLGLVLSRVCVGGHLLVTVPSFQSLFSSHDLALRHFRRYSLSELERAVRQSGGELVGSGYLFGSLLPVRIVQKLLELVKPPKAVAEFGVGGWHAPQLLTRGIELAFRLDSALLLGVGAGGLKLPGLSAWALCKKQS